MKFEQFLGKRVQFDISNGWHYIGNVIDVDDDSITINDKYNCRVTILKTEIVFIRETP